MTSRDKNNDYWTHKCPWTHCSATFMTRPEYNRHQEVIHPNEKGLKSKKCGFSKCHHIFLTNEDYTDHMQRIHGVLMDKKRGVAMATC